MGRHPGISEQAKASSSSSSSSSSFGFFVVFFFDAMAGRHSVYAPPVWDCKTSPRPGLPKGRAKDHGGECKTTTNSPCYCETTMSDDIRYKYYTDTIPQSVRSEVAEQGSGGLSLKPGAHQSGSGGRFWSEVPEQFRSG